MSIREREKKTQTLSLSRRKRFIISMADTKKRLESYCICKKTFMMNVQTLRVFFSFLFIQLNFTLFFTLLQSTRLQQFQLNQWGKCWRFFFFFYFCFAHLLPSYIKHFYALGTYWDELSMCSVTNSFFYKSIFRLMFSFVSCWFSCSPFAL